MRTKVFILVFSFIIAVLNTKFGFIYSHDEIIPLSNQFITNYFFTWSINDFGFPSSGGIPKIVAFLFFLPFVYYPKFGEFIVIATLTFFSLFYFLKLSCRLTKCNNSIGLLGSIFYISNPFVVFYIWRTANLMTRIWFLSLLPASLYFLDKYFTSRNYKHLGLFFVTSFFMIPSFTHPAFLIIYLMLILIFLTKNFYHYWPNKTAHFIIISFKIFSVLFLINFFWLASRMFSLSDELKNAATIGLSESLIKNSESIDFTNVMAGVGFGSLKEKNLWYDWQWYYQSTPVIIAGLILLIFMIFPLFIKNKPKKDLYFYFPFLLTFIVGMALAFGINFSEYILNIFEKFKFLYAFRDPGKWYNLTLLPQSILLVYGISLLKEKINNKKYKIFLYSFCVVILLILGWPVLTGFATRSGSSDLPGSRVNIPKEYFEVNKLLSNKRIIVIPFVGSQFESSWDFGNYKGVYILRSITGKSFISIFNPNLKDRIKNIAESVAMGDLYLANKYNIQQIILHHDMKMSEREIYEYSKFKDILSKSKYKVLADNKYFTVYDLGENSKTKNFNNQLNSISAFNSLLKFNTLSNLEEKYNFALNDLKKDFYFVSDADGLENKKTLAVSNIFENITPANLENSKIKVDLGEASGEKLLYSKELTGKLLLNGQPIDFDGGFGEKAVELTGRGNVFEYENENFKFDNIIQNGSFEEGAWGEEVGDCSNYDENPILKMGLNKAEKTEGEQSLQLEATRHNACVSKKLPVKENSSYLVSFDYQSPNSKIASYYLAFDDEAKTVFSENIDLKGEGWQNFSKVIKAPVGATKLSLYVYAKQSDGKENVINRYDNFKLIEVPDLSNAFYLVDKEERKFEEPKAVDFDLINPTKKLVHVRGAKTPFYLAMSESFHPQWQLQMNNEKIQGYLNKWWPFVRPDRVRDEYHYKLDDFLNAWYVDPAEMCAKNRACVKHSDGSYDMEMTLEFFPQRWFYLGLIISGTTLLGCLGYLVWAGRKGIAEFFGKIVNFVGKRKGKKREKNKNKSE